MFELLIAAMVLVVLICMLVIISKVDINLKDAFSGYLPSKYIFAQGGIYTSVGIIGATVMPHSLFLGSTLATQDRIEFREGHSDETLVDSRDHDEPTKRSSRIRRFLAVSREFLVAAFRKPPPNLYAAAATRYSEHTNNSYEFVRAHIYHGTVDMIGSLLSFAVVINSLILMLASSVFFYTHPTTDKQPASLFDAYDLIRDLVGLPAAKIFAVALLCAGQSSSIIATVAGQAISEGFLQWRVSAIVRRLLTRLLAIIPSMIVAIALGRSGVDALLVASQVVLSVVLPFILFPLIWCTSSKAIMSVKKNGGYSEDHLKENLSAREVETPGSDLNPSRPKNEMARNTAGTEERAEERVEYSNPKIISILAWAIWLLITAANVYALVEIGTNAL
jgi:metal iron transporter